MRPHVRSPRLLSAPLRSSPVGKRPRTTSVVNISQMAPPPAPFFPATIATEAYQAGYERGRREGR